MPVFISEVKKENSAKKKNEYGDICFLMNYKFFMRNILQNNKFFVSVVTLCDIFFILDLTNFLDLMFFYKIDFSLENKLRAFFSLCFCVLLLANSM